MGHAATSTLSPRRFRRPRGTAAGHQGPLPALHQRRASGARPVRLGHNRRGLGQLHDQPRSPCPRHPGRAADPQFRRLMARNQLHVRLADTQASSVVVLLQINALDRTCNCAANLRGDLHVRKTSSSALNPMQPPFSAAFHTVRYSPPNCTTLAQLRRNPPFKPVSSPSARQTTDVLLARPFPLKPMISRAYSDVPAFSHLLPAFCRCFCLTTPSLSTRPSLPARRVQNSHMFQ